MKRSIAKAFALSLLTTAGLAQADLIYQFDFDADGGSGTTVSDTSGFGSPADGTTFTDFNPPVATDLFSAATPSPNGDLYGNFEASRSRLQFDSAKFNDDVDGVAGGSNAFTVTMLIRDFDATSGDSDGNSLFGYVGNDLDIGFVGGGSNEMARQMQMRLNANNRESTVGTFDMTNATTGDSNGWILWAFTYSSDTDTGTFYVFREFDASTGWSMVTTESIVYPTSEILEESGGGSLTDLEFNSASSRDADCKLDGMQVYSRVLTEMELAQLHVDGASVLDVAITSSGPVTSGEALVYTVEVENTDSSNAANFTQVMVPANMALPSGASFNAVASSASQGMLFSGGSDVIWDVGTIAPSATVTATITLDTTTPTRFNLQVLAVSPDGGSDSLTLLDELIAFVTDLDLDGSVDSVDFSTLADQFGTVSATGDVDDSGVVDLDDLALLVADLGLAI